MSARIGRPRTHSLNEGYFDTLTPRSAYFLGLVQADGGVNRRTNNLRVSLKGSDADLLRIFARELEYDGPLPEYLNFDRYPAVLLSVYSLHMTNTLVNQWGIVSPKVYTASTHPDLLYDRDYWRGVIDGDGSLSEDGNRRSLSLVGSRMMCDQFLSLLQTHGLGARISVKQHKNIYRVRLGSYGESCMAAKILYEDAEIALERKAAIAARWMTSALMHSLRPQRNL